MIRLEDRTNMEEVMQVQKLILDGFESKFSSVGLSKKQLEELLFYLWALDEKQDDEQYVSIEDGKVNGTIMLKRQNKKAQLDVSMWTLWKKFGFFKVWKMIDVLEILSYEVEDHEVYIDHIVVSKSARGHHIGTELIKHAMDTLNGNEYLSLFVAKSNDRAYKLYETLGFEAVSIVKDEAKGKIVGEEDWFYMVYDPRN